MKSRKLPSQKRAFYRRRGFWVIVVLTLLTGGGAAWFFFNRDGTAQPTSRPDPTVLTTTVQRGDVRQSASGSGTLAAAQTVDLSFSTGGTVRELNVKVGDWVEVGEELAHLGQALDLEVNLASAELQLLEARQSLQALHQNAEVSLAQAYQDLLSAQQDYADAETASQRMSYGRCSQEVRTRYAAALERAQEKLSELGQAEYGSDLWIDARHDFDTALANFDYCSGYTAVEKTNTQAELAIAAAAVSKAEETYETLKGAAGINPDVLALAKVKVSEAEKNLAAAQEVLTGIRLSAPIAGKVISLAANQGAIVGTDIFITIADVRHPVVEVSIDETDLDKLITGSSAAVTFDALPDQTFSGTVVRVDPTLTASGPYRVATGLVALDEDAARIVQNMPLGLSASVVVIGQEAKDVLVVPVTALQDLGEEGYGVMVVGGDGQLRSQTVQVGLQDGKFAEITAGLEEGQRISLAVDRSAANSTNGFNEGNFMFPVNGPPDGGMLPPP